MPLSEFTWAQTPQVLQTQQIEQVADVTTTSTTFVDLGAVTITLLTSGGSCVCYFSVSASNATINTNVRFQLMIDGVSVRGVKIRRDATSGTSATIIYRTSTLTAGSHIFKIQWSVSAGTGQVRSTTVSDEGATLLVEELTR